MHEQTHRHAAIMFTDIVGYTALMGSNEDKAFEVLKKNQDIHKKLILQFNGTLIKEMGDGMLISFDLASEAVRCAIEIQKAGKEHNIPLKIGIHEGEMVFADADVLGDGVNIASRLQENAEKGCIHISSSVYKNVRNKADINTRFVEERTFKNVAEPVKVYKVLGEGEEQIPGANKLKNRNKKYPLWAGIGAALVIVILAFYLYPKIFTESSKDNTEIVTEAGNEILDKSLAILPFEDLSPNQDQEYFSIGMMEEILSHLYKIEDLRLPSRTTSMKYKDTKLSAKEIGEEIGVSYILQGSVRKAKNRLRITLQLIDAKNDIHLWSEAFDRDLTDVFAIQTEVAKSVAYTLKAEVNPQVIDRLGSIPTENLEAYDYYLKSLKYFGTPTLNTQDARVWLREAIRLDSNFARAYGLLGTYILFQAGFAQDKSPDEVGQESKELLEKALLLDPTDAFTHTMMADYNIWYEKDFKKAEINYNLGIKLAPSDVNSYVSYLDLLLSLGRFDEAITISSKILEIADNDPGNWGRDVLMWGFVGEKDKMNYGIEKILQINSDGILPYTESARALLIQKEYDRVPEILSHSQEAQSLPRSMGLKSIAYFKLGDMDNHNKELNSLIERSTKTAGGSPSFYTAMVYASKGEINEAFTWLKKSFEDNELELYWLKVEPEFEPIYDDPRWQEMLDKVGFPE